MKKTGIEDIRREIRHKDRELVRLLNERARLSLEVGKIKGREGIGVYDPAQESRVLAEIAALVLGPGVLGLLGEVLDRHFDLQREPLRLRYHSLDCSTGFVG